MKSHTQVVQEAKRRLTARWHLAITGNDEDGWPYKISLGRLPKATLEADFPTVQKWALSWRDWATRHSDVTVNWTNRLVMGTEQQLPTHVVVPSAEAAALLIGEGWPSQLARAASRRDVLQAQFSHVDLAITLRASDTLDDVDFDLLCRASRWFSTHDATGLTPRQVPIEGLHGKWLNAHHSLVRSLAGKDELGLVKRPTRVHLTYLDPRHHQTGGRIHESITLGDIARPAYPPGVVIILENKDTAVYFPPVRSGIAVEGEGYKAPGVLTHLPWLVRCPHIFYWGDIDAAGYEIVHRLRASGVYAETLLMDEDTYARYERFGSWTDERGRPIPCAKRKPLHHLHGNERVVYDHITDPSWTRARRVEQERIPLDEAARHLAAALHAATRK
jgi:hypothetical protein